MSESENDHGHCEQCGCCSPSEAEEAFEEGWVWFKVGPNEALALCGKCAAGPCTRCGEPISQGLDPGTLVLFYFLPGQPLDEPLFYDVLCIPCWDELRTMVNEWKGTKSDGHDSNQPSSSN